MLLPSFSGLALVFSVHLGRVGTLAALALVTHLVESLGLDRFHQSCLMTRFDLWSQSIPCSFIVGSLRC